MPAAYVMMDAFPLIPNGKLDRKALPAPDDEAFARHSYEPPQGEVETGWRNSGAELLGIERVGRHDNFFELGGHSLLAVQLMERLRRAGLGSSAHLFATPVLAELAATLGSYREAAVPPNTDYRPGHGPDTGPAAADRPDPGRDRPHPRQGARGIGQRAGYLRLSLRCRRAFSSIIY